MKLPSNVGYEQLVLAGMMNNEESFYDGVSNLESDFFTTPENTIIFEKLKSKENMPSASFLIKESIEPKEKSAIRLIDSTWTNYNDFQQALNGLKEVYKKRQLYYSINKLENRFNEESSDSLLEEFSREIMSIAVDETDQDVIDPEEHAAEFLGRFYEIFANPEASKGLSYSLMNEKGQIKGIPSLDETFNGAQPGDLIMVAAKTGEGKTAFAINLARIFSMDQNYIGYYLNTEMRTEELISRLLAPIARVKSNEIETGRMEGAKHEWSIKRDSISAAFEQYRKSKLILSRLPHLPLYKAKGLAKQVRLRFGGLDYLVVDYVGRMAQGNTPNPWDELYDITKGLKELAVELDIPIFMLAQRNQAGEVEGAKKMMNECDGVLFFEPITEEDREYIPNFVRRDKIPTTNYRIVKKKVRRNDNAQPIYCQFDKSKSLIIEADKP